MGLLINVAHAGPMIISEDPGARYLVEFLQHEAADLAEFAVIDLDLAVVADYYYHPNKNRAHQASSFRLWPMVVKS